MDIEVQVISITSHHEKTGARVTRPLAERASELHDLLSCHLIHIHIHVGDIPQVEGRKGEYESIG